MEYNRILDRVSKDRGISLCKEFHVDDVLLFNMDTSKLYRMHAISCHVYKLKFWVEKLIWIIFCSKHEALILFLAGSMLVENISMCSF